MGFLQEFFHTPSVPKVPVHDYNIDDLDYSLNLLRKKTLEVSEAAVSATKVLEEKLNDSEYRFFSTIDAVNDMIVVKDGLGRWKTANIFAQHLFKFEDNRYIGKTDSQLMDMYPEYADTFLCCLTSDEATWHSRKSHRFDEVIPYGRDNMYFDVIKTPIFSNEGDRKELIIIGRDVTVLRAEERRMKACFLAMNSVSDLIVILDKSGSIFFSNDQFLSTFNIQEYESVVGKKLSDIIPFLRTIPEYKQVLEQVKTNKEWHGVLWDQYSINILPVKNGVPDPVFYICTLKPNINKQ